GRLPVTGAQSPLPCIPARWLPATSVEHVESPVAWLVLELGGEEQLAVRCQDRKIRGVVAMRAGDHRVVLVQQQISIRALRDQFDEVGLHLRGTSLAGWPWTAGRFTPTLSGCSSSG